MKVINLFGGPGCLSGDTDIYVSVKTKNGIKCRGNVKKLHYIYKKFNNLHCTGKGGHKKWNVVDNKYYILSARDKDNYLFNNEIVNIIQSGIKQTILVKTKTGKSIRATNDHKFLTKNGYVPLSSLNVGDTLQVSHKHKAYENNRTRTLYKELFIKYHPNSSKKVINKYTYYRIPEQYIVLEAYINGLSISDYINYCNSHNEQNFKLKTINRKTHVIHHKDKNKINNIITNLELMLINEHNILHANEFSGNNMTHISDEIIFIGDPINEMTYDIQMNAPKHNFVANEFIVHNCGKSTTSSMLFSSLKLDDISCELINEYAKGKVWEGSLNTLDDQLYVFAKQYHRQFIVDNKVDYAVTDSPILLSLFYGKNKSQTFKDLVLERFNEYDNINIFLIRTKAFQQAGRQQNEEEAHAIDDAILEILDELGIKYYTVMADDKAHLEIRRILNV